VRRTGIDVDRFLKVGQAVRLSLHVSDEIVKRGSSESEEMVAYNTQIQDLSREELIVAWPTDRTVHVPLSSGQPVALEIRCHLGVLCLDSQVVATRYGPVPVLHIARGGDWSRSQLRSSVRLDVAVIPHQTTLVSTNGHSGQDVHATGPEIDLDAIKKSQIHGESIRVVIRNLSAAGLLLASETRLEPGSIVRISFPLGKNQPDIDAFAMIVRVLEDMSRSKTYPFKAGCRFLGLGTKDQDSITRFILVRQAELRRSGLL